MAETSQLGLPLVQAAQAQKHVTVNEALARLDGLVQLRMMSRGVSVPPVAAVDGQIWAVPVGAVNAWAGRDGMLAIRMNGGWDFVAPKQGWHGWLQDEGVPATFDGLGWRSGAVALSANRAGSFFRVLEFDQPIVAGNTVTAIEPIPAGSMVFAVTARVLETITGTATSWRLGNAGSLARFGSGLGIQAGSWGRGMLSAPMTFYDSEALLLTATGGSFTGGRVRLAMHLFEVGLPSA